MDKIPIQLVKIQDEAGERNIEIMMDLGDFETSGATIRSMINEFKKKYLKAINEARKIDALSKAKKSKRKVSIKSRWKACKIIADFNRDANNKFTITNYKEAYSRDFGIPMRSIRTYIDFGNIFTEHEILDNIPYSIYAELVFKANELDRKRLLDSEKEYLLSSAKKGTLPNRDEYRDHLNSVVK